MAQRSRFGPERLRAGCGGRKRAAPFRALRSAACLVALLALAATLGACQSTSFGRPSLAGRYQSEDVVGRIRFHRIRGDETLLDLTRRYDLGYVELVAANPGVDPWVPGVGTRILLPMAHTLPPTPRKGIVINLAEQRLYAFDDQTGEPIHSFPIGVSRDGWSTPIGVTTVVKKTEKPIWYPTKSAIREDPTLPAVVRAGPENPLGDYALYLAWPRYLIHGTNEPDGVGRKVSRGCIRLYPEDIERLFASTSLGDRVQVIDEPVKLAWVGSDVYLEVHPSFAEMAQIEEKGRLEPIHPADLRPRIRAFAGRESHRVDWRRAYQVAAERRGVPIRITP